MVWDGLRTSQTLYKHNKCRYLFVSFYIFLLQLPIELPIELLIELLRGLRVDISLDVQNARKTKVNIDLVNIRL